MITGVCIAIYIIHVGIVGVCMALCTFSQVCSGQSTEECRVHDWCVYREEGGSTGDGQVYLQFDFAFS